MRFIAIDHNSGFIWGDADTDTPQEACAVIDHEADASRPRRDFAAVPPIRDTSTSYHVYAVPTDFPAIDDGQDQAMIERVEREGRWIGDFAPWTD